MPLNLPHAENGVVSVLLHSSEAQSFYSCVYLLCKLFRWFTNCEYFNNLTHIGDVWCFAVFLLLPNNFPHGIIKLYCKLKIVSHTTFSLKKGGGKCSWMKREGRNQNGRTSGSRRSMKGYIVYTPGSKEKTLNSTGSSEETILISLAVVPHRGRAGSWRRRAGGRGQKWNR